MNTKLSIFAILTVLVFPLSHVHADENTEISINFLDGKILDLKDKNRLVRADIIIENFDPQDGYYFMRVTNLFTGEVIKNSEIQPKYRGDQKWGMQTSFLVDDTQENIIGEYEVIIHTEFGTSTASTTFSIVDSKKNPLVTNGTGTIQELNESKTLPQTTSSSLLPQWVRNIFILYADEKISELELISALEYLIDQDILQIK